MTIDHITSEITFTFTFVHFQTLLSKATYNWGYIKRLILKRQIDRGSAHNTLRNYSNKYKLAREGEKDKKKDEDLENGK